MFPGLFSICLIVFMPEADSLKHPPRYYPSLPHSAISQLPNRLLSIELHSTFTFTQYISNPKAHTITTNQQKTLINHQFIDLN